MNHREVLEALLAGETLVDMLDENITLRLDGGIIINESLREKGNIILRNWKIKPKTININGFEVPEPVREPLSIGDEYFTPTVLGDKACQINWRNDGNCMKRLKNGLVHLTKEAATLHSKALLSFTEKQ